MKVQITIAFLLLSTLAMSQFTVTGRYVINNTDVVENLTSTDGIPRGYEIDLGYWFRLKNKRLEFIPEIGYTSLPGNDEISASGFNVNLNVLIYPLDFHNDCNSCPTFSKEGGTIKKGFHWIIAPSWANLSLETPLIDLSSNDLSTFRLGLGAGLDIGVTNLLAVTPIIMINVGKQFDEFSIPGEDASRYRQVHLGLRATLRLDKDKW